MGHSLDPSLLFLWGMAPIGDVLEFWLLVVQFKLPGMVEASMFIAHFVGRVSFAFHVCTSGD